MKTELETVAGQVQELTIQKADLEKKLVAAQNTMAGLQGRYTIAARELAVGSASPSEKPADVQKQIAAQQITVDGLEAALSECQGKLDPLVAYAGELHNARIQQLALEDVQTRTAAALKHGDEVLRLHSELQVDLRIYRVGEAVPWREQAP